MREILFRGKRTKTGEWVTGNLWHHTEKASLIWSNELDTKAWVLPETVGQFTGLTDKNGKKIFEGDIVESFDIFNHWDGYGIVNWNETFNSWCMGERLMYCDRIATYEVIGNIYDNPELLGGGGR